MKIAIITGASSGLGREYALKADKMYSDIDELWLVARRREKLEETAAKLSKKVKILTFDITDETFFSEFKSLLSFEHPEIKLLINNAGFGKLGPFEKSDINDDGKMIRLNCEALTVMTAVCLPFMNSGSEIINTCSIAAFAPNTNMAVYSSTKAYVMSFSKALRAELKGRKINVLAVCPGPMDTEFLPVAGIAPGASKTFDTLPRVRPDVMAYKSLIASSKGRGIYTNLAFYKFYRLIAKILPHGLIMKICGA